MPCSTINHGHPRRTFPLPEILPRPVPGRGGEGGGEGRQLGFYELIKDNACFWELLL